MMPTRSLRSLRSLFTLCAVLTLLVGPAAAAQQSATAQLSIQVVAPLAITTTRLPSGLAGQPYAATITVTGGLAPYFCSWQAATGSTLPVWATLSATATGCAIAGTPPSSAGYVVAVSVKDSTGLAASFGGHIRRGFGHRLLHLLSLGRK